MAGRITSSLLILAVVAGAAISAYATDYNVGDSQGWTSGVDYDTWASDKTFLLGDSLVFQYASLHSVDEVAASDYDSCSSGNAIQSFTDQNSKITFTQPGPHYFICGTPGHCSNGMKLAVNVSASGAADAGGGSPSSSSPTPSDSTPSMSPETPSTEPASSDTTPTSTTTSKSTPTTTTSGAMGHGFRGEHGLLIGGLLLGLRLMGF